MRMILLALFALIAVASSALPFAQPASAQTEFSDQRRTVAQRCRTDRQFARNNPRTCARYSSAKQKPQAEQPKPPEQPTRPEFTAADQDAAKIPGIPDARFWADSEAGFTKALPTQRGPWLALSTGGGDGAFGAGLLNGWSESGKRPVFAVVTGTSTGALMAPFAFIGSSKDDGLKRAYTEYNAGDIFEDTKTPESLVDTWPLKRLIAKEVTPELLALIAEGHRQGRRLFVQTTNLDATRGVVWNMGEIAAKGDEAALKLFRDILLASTAIPGLFPPVLIEVEGADGKKTAEMHADGGLSAQVFIAPEPILNSSSDYKLPASELYVVANTRLSPEFQAAERSMIGVLARSITVGVQTMLRNAIDRGFALAKRSDVPFYLAWPALNADQQGSGVFDSEFMKGLFEIGAARGRTGTPFARDTTEAFKLPAKFAK